MSDGQTMKAIIDQARAEGIAEGRRQMREEAALRRGFYVASRASVPERAAMWRALRRHGHLINSTWIDEAGEGETKDLSELWERITREISRSEALIFYTKPNDLPLKGALVEAGIALGMGIPVRAVLPGVSLESPSMRPVGSWLRHPLVTICTLEQAFRALPDHPEEPADG